MTPKSKSKSEPAPIPERAFDTRPRVALVLTGETIYVTRFDERGAPQLTYPVASADVANIFNGFGAETGVLPPDTLFWQSLRGRLRIGIYLPPAMRTLAFAIGRRVTKITIPLPGFVFAGLGTQYEIEAVRARPLRESDQLYRAPLPNVSEDGRICFGSAHPPRCGPDTIAGAAQIFFESEFNDHMAEGKIASLMQDQDEADEDLPEDVDVDAALAQAEINENVDGDTPDGFHGHETVAIVPDRNRVAAAPQRQRRRNTQSLLVYLRTLESRRRFPEHELVPSVRMSQFMKTGV